MKIKDIYQSQSALWDESNRKFFGVGCRDWKTMRKDEVQKSLNEDISNYWNTDNEHMCEVAKLILDGTICHGIETMKKNSFEMNQNIISQCIDLYGTFISEKKGEKVEKRLLIATFPTPCSDLTWIIGGKNGGTKYTPRITCTRDYKIIRKSDNIITHGKYNKSDYWKKSEDFWTYDLETKVFDVFDNTKKPFDLLSYRSKCLLEGLIGEELTENNFEYALSKMIEFDSSSIFNFEFYHIDAFFNMIRSASQFANPTKNIHLAINTIFNRQVNIDDDPESSGKLVLVNHESSIDTLENFRTIVYSKNAANQKKRWGKNSKKKKSFIKAFSFSDTKGFFDAFKTAPQSQSAGRQRLLLDNVNVHDGMLYVVDEFGKEHNMFEALNKDLSFGSNISCISKSLFCNNNTPKRIMMTAKLSPQAISTVGSIDDFTHDVPARVVFGEFEGWTYADSIIISESFAKKLRHDSVVYQDIYRKDPGISNVFKKLDENSDDMSLDINDLRAIFKSKNDYVMSSYENAEILKFEFLSDYRARIAVKFSIPFHTGDKITNRHGSKGVSGLVLADDKMPRLVNDIGDFKAGPFEVIISGYSIMRRKSPGQIFEAWARASGIDFEPGEDFAKFAVDKYSKEMKEFSKKSLVEFNGEVSLKPCGIIHMIRLYHHATTKISDSYIRSNFNKSLKMGEQEKLNLCAMGSKNILKELSIRSMRKYENSYKLAYDIIKTGSLPKEKNLHLSLEFARMLKSMGLMLEVNGEPLVEKDICTINDYQEFFGGVVNNDFIDLEDIYLDSESHEEE